MDRLDLLSRTLLKERPTHHRAKARTDSPALRLLTCLPATLPRRPRLPSTNAHSTSRRSRCPLQPIRGSTNSSPAARPVRASPDGGRRRLRTRMAGGGSCVAVEAGGVRVRLGRGGTCRGRERGKGIVEGRGATALASAKAENAVKRYLRCCRRVGEG